MNGECSPAVVALDRLSEWKRKNGYPRMQENFEKGVLMMPEKEELTDEQIENVKEEISNLSRHEMCRLMRFAPIGHPYFDTSLPFNEVFKVRFDKLGGFSPEISKRLGWES